MTAVEIRALKKFFYFIISSLNRVIRFCDIFIEMALKFMYDAILINFQGLCYFDKTLNMFNMSICNLRSFYIHLENPTFPSQSKWNISFTDLSFSERTKFKHFNKLIEILNWKCRYIVVSSIKQITLINEEGKFPFSIICFSPLFLCFFVFSSAHVWCWFFQFSLSLDIIDKLIWFFY